MTTTVPDLASLAPMPSTCAGPAVPSLAKAVGDAAEVVAGLGVDDPQWDEVGPLLTSFVDAARRSTGLAGSPIGRGEDVSPVLRLRDLGRLSAKAAGLTGGCTAATAPVASCLRSLQIAARRSPSG